MTRFIDNQDGTVTDTQSGFTWPREDSWLKEQKWVTWDEAKEYAVLLNDLGTGGRKNWRLPNIDEIKTLVTETPGNKDHYGKDLLLDAIFTPGGLPNVWLHEGATGNEGFFLNMTTGEIGQKFKSVAGRMAARPVSEP